MNNTRANRQRSETIRIYNKSRQLVSLQVKPPKGDFFLTEQQVHVRSGKSVLLLKNFVRLDQITNLAARGILRVTYDSEAAAM